MTTPELIAQVGELLSEDVAALKTSVAAGTPISLQQGEGLSDTAWTLLVLHEVAKQESA